MLLGRQGINFSFPLELSVKRDSDQLTWIINGKSRSDKHPMMYPGGDKQVYDHQERESVRNSKREILLAQ